MYGTAALRGADGALGFVRCAVDFVGSARQAFAGASAFNQNIGGWNTASVTTMALACALPPSHACGVQPTSLLAAVVSAASGPRHRCEVAHLGCGRVPTQMLATSSRRCGSGLAQL
jgi:surface protein